MPPSRAALKRAREADVDLGDEAVTAARGFSFAPAALDGIAPWKGKYPKFRFKALEHICSLAQLRIGDVVWKGSSPHLSFSFSLRPVASLRINLPCDVEQTDSPIPDLEEEHQFGDSTLSTATPAYSITLSAARLERAVVSSNMFGRALLELIVDPSAATLEYKSSASSGSVELPAGDATGAKLEELLRCGPIRIECVSGDRLFAEIGRDLRDYCEKVISTGGKV